MAETIEKNDKKEYKKNFIGKGRQVEGIDIVRVSINMEKAKEFFHEFKDTCYLTFEIARLREEDDFGKTHTVYVSKETKPEIKEEV